MSGKKKNRSKRTLEKILLTTATLNLLYTGR